MGAEGAFGLPPFQKPAAPGSLHYPVLQGEFMERGCIGEPTEIMQVCDCSALTVSGGPVEKQITKEGAGDYLNL